MFLLVGQTSDFAVADFKLCLCVLSNSQSAVRNNTSSAICLQVEMENFTDKLPVI